MPFRKDTGWAVANDRYRKLAGVHNSFMASSTHLFSFVMNYRYRKEVTRGEKLIFFCQLASQYADELRFTDTYEISDEVEYPLIYAK